MTRDADKQGEPEFPASSDQQYFLAIEDLLLRLRGAPLMLSPKEWQLARRWHEAGIPVALVLDTMETVFHQREERQAKGKVNSLSYFKQPIEAAWKELQELGLFRDAGSEPNAAAGVSGEELDLPQLVQRLAEHLPGTIPEAAGWREKILSCWQPGLLPSEVEARLAALDAELLDAIAKTIEEETSQEIDTQVAKTLEALRGRVDPEQTEAVRRRLFNQRLRARVGLPTLSLFSASGE